jgi:hypothetical protein
MPPKVPALSNTVSDRDFCEITLTGQDIPVLFRDPDWESFTSQNQQITFQFDFPHSNCAIGLSNQVLARVFTISAQNVSKIRSNVQNSHKPPHRRELSVKFRKDRFFSFFNKDFPQDSVSVSARP